MYMYIHGPGPPPSLPWYGRRPLPRVDGVDVLMYGYVKQRRLCEGAFPLLLWNLCNFKLIAFSMKTCENH